MVAQNPSDQQDTVVLSRGVPAAKVPDEPTPPVTHDTMVLTHDTVVLRTPDTTPPVPPVPGGYPAGGPAVRVNPPQGGPYGAGPGPQVGWQAVADWRTAMPPRSATAWSQVPPFIPANRPVLVMRNNAAVVGATLGSVSLFLSLLPLLGIVAWVLAPIGLLTSVVGLLVGMTRKVGRVGALWGIATSGMALLVCLAWTALLLAL